MYSLLCTIVLSLALHISSVRSSPFLSGCRVTEWYSEEQGYADNRLIGYPMTALECKGRHCDSLRAEQCTQVNNQGNSAFLKASMCEEMSWTFSEEGSGTGSCPDGMFVESMKCEGGYCDNIRLRCCKTSSWYPDQAQQVVTPWFSDGGEQCQPMYAVIGASCKGAYCDTMLLICAPIIAAAQAGQTFGSWSAVCSSNIPYYPCRFATTESISRDRQPTWDNAFSASVNSSIASGVLLNGSSVVLQTGVQENVGQLVALDEDTTKSCSPELKKQKSELIETVWWQWIMETEDISITDQDGSKNRLHMATCFFFMTDGFENYPKCPPGNCDNSNCQICVK